MEMQEQRAGLQEVVQSRVNWKRMGEEAVAVIECQDMMVAIAKNDRFIVAHGCLPSITVFGFVVELFLFINWGSFALLSLSD